MLDAPWPASETLLFGPFELRPDTGELRRDGRPLALPPQPAKALALLALRSGEVVSREELRRHLWGDEVHVDFDNGLNFCIRQIRAALGDAREAPTYIETLPKRGYRFLVAVDRQRLHPWQCAPAEAPRQPHPGTSPVRKRRLAAAVASSTVVLAALAGMFAPGGGGAARSPVRLAVLPVVEAQPAAGAAYLADRDGVSVSEHAPATLQIVAAAQRRVACATLNFRAS